MCYNTIYQKKRRGLNMSSNVTQWIIAVIIVGFIGYSSYKSILMFVSFKKESKKFLENNSDAESFTEGKGWFVLLIIATLVCLVLAIKPELLGEVDSYQLFYYHLAYIVLTIVFAGMILESYARKKVWFTDDGLFYIDKYYRYRSILSYDEHRGMLNKSMSILMSNKDSLEVNLKLGQEIQVHAQSWKKTRKEEKKRRHHR